MFLRNLTMQSVHADNYKVFVHASMQSVHVFMQCLYVICLCFYAMSIFVKSIFYMMLSSDYYIILCMQAFYGLLYIESLFSAR